MDAISTQFRHELFLAHGRLDNVCEISENGDMHAVCGAGATNFEFINRHSEGMPPPAGLRPLYWAFFANDWRLLPTDIMMIIVSLLTFSDISCARLVCRDWREVFSICIKRLRPRMLPPGALPATFPALRYLDLKSCRRVMDGNLTGIHKLSMLRVLSLECDGITDSAADAIAALPQLKVLSLKHCMKLTDRAIWKLCGVEERMLRLLASPRKPPTSPRSGATATNNTGIASPLPLPPLLQHTEKPQIRPPLESLDLSGCVMLTDRGLSCLAQAFPDLSELHIGGCSRMASVTDACLLGISKCTKLQNLDLSGCTSITNAGFAYLSSLHHLTFLNLWNCVRLTPDALGALSSCVNLAELSLRGCQLMNDAAFSYIAPLKGLEKLDLRACEHVRGGELTRLSTLRHLTELNVSGCYALSDIGLAAIGVLRMLRVLRLSECWQITNAGLSGLKGLTQLEELDLTGCRNIINEMELPLEGIHALHALTTLSLRGCDRLTNGALEFLDLTNNVIGAGLQTCFTNDIKLTHLDLSGCKNLNGAALKSLKHCATSLKSLKLQYCVGLCGRNALVGLEPLTTLTYLHLGGCTGLLGTAFASLGTLSSLKYLNMEGLINVPLMDRGLLTVGWGCKELTSISLGGCNTLGDDGIAALGHLPRLKSANFNDCCNITGLGFETWTDSSLTSLQLQGALSLSDQGIAAVGLRLKNLQELSLKNCREVTDDGIIVLTSSLNQLKSLSFQGMLELTDVGVVALCAVRSLSSLELQFCCQFGDEGACELTKLTNLTSLDLMYSWKVTDVTMEALGGMLNLKNLNILGCDMVGPEGKAAVAHLLHDDRRM